MRLKSERVPLTTRHLSRANIPQRFWGVRLSLVPNGLRPPVESYIRSLDERIDAGDGLLLRGTNGTGKTSSSVVIAQEVMRRGGTVLFLTTHDLLRALLSLADFDGLWTLEERVSMVDLLVLDDLGKEHRGSSQWAERMIEGVLRQRSADRKSTIVTTNIPVGGRSGLESIYSTSFVSVVRETLYPVRITGDDRRMPASNG